MFLQIPDKPPVHSVFLRNQEEEKGAAPNRIKSYPL